MASPLMVGLHAARTRLGVLWFGVLAGPVVWSVLALVSYVLAAQSCAPAGLRRAHPVFTGVRAFVGMLTLVGLVIVIAALITAVRSRLAAGHAPVPHDATWSRVHFMAGAGVITSAVFLLGIVLQGIGVIVIPACL